MPKNARSRYFVRIIQKPPHIQQNHRCADVRYKFENIAPHTQEKRHCADVRVCTPYGVECGAMTRAHTLFPKGV